MAGVPALRSTAIRLPVSSTEARAPAAAQAPASPATATGLRRVEPIAATASARPQDRAAALLLCLARDQVVIEANASSPRPSGLSSAGRRAGALRSRAGIVSFRRLGTAALTSVPTAMAGCGGRKVVGLIGAMANGRTAAIAIFFL